MTSKTQPHPAHPAISVSLAEGGSDDESNLMSLCRSCHEKLHRERGDIWTVGRHKLICGDATIVEDVDALMDGKRANLGANSPCWFLPAICTIFSAILRIPHFPIF